MKKFLRFMVVLILVVGTALVILMFVEPTDVTVTRSAMIKAPKEAVFAKISHFKQWPQWSPWYRLDTTMKVDYAGIDGEAGSSYHWVGNDKVGEGTMKSVAIHGTHMDFHLDIVKPYDIHPDGYLKTEDTAGMTKATWSMKMHIGKPWNAMLIFMNMEKALAPDFENGLNNLKTLTEGQGMGAASGDAEVKEVDFPAHMYAGMRKTVAWSDLSKFFSDSYTMLGKSIGPKINGVPTGFFYIWDTTKKNTDMAAAFPVSDTLSKIKGVTFMYVPATKAYMAVRKGGYSGEMKVHEALKQYMSSKGKTMNYCVEEYVVGMPQEADSNKWVTNIYYLAK